MLAREVDDVDVRDMAGNTPLMYTVMGRQPKVLSREFTIFSSKTYYYLL